jgi:hypothetical protein
MEVFLAVTIAEDSTMTEAETQQELAELLLAVEYVRLVAVLRRDEVGGRSESRWPAEAYKGGGGDE